MVLKLRLGERAELTATEAWGSIEAFEKYLNEHSAWMFQQKERRWLNAKWITYPTSVILLCEKIKLVLSPPTIDHDGENLYYYFRVKTVLTANREDRIDAMTGRQVDEPIEVEENVPDIRLPPPPIVRPVEQPATILEKATAPTATTVPPKAAIEKETKPTVPTTPLHPNDDHQRFIITPTCLKCDDKLVPERGLYCQHCGVRLPCELAVHRELVIAIKKKDYDKLATHLKQKVSVAWSRMLHGREIRKKVVSVGENIFLITIKDELRTSTEDAEQELDRLLIETGIGRLTADPYELREAHKMLDGRPPPEA